MTARSGPFRLLVRLDQPTVQGLSRHGERTRLYTSRARASGSAAADLRTQREITVLTLASVRRLGEVAPPQGSLTPTGQSSGR